MALVGLRFFDTSVLLAGLIDLGAPARPAQRVFDAIADGRLSRPHTAWHCCLEFYAVSTRLPEEFRLTPADCWRLMEEELLARFEIHQLPKKAGKSFFQAAAADRMTGGRIYDAHIAEIARLAGAKVVVTDNRRHFTPLLRHGIRVLSAEEFARDLPS
ncbi:MAG: PIN domain-containing protein [Thermoanaerobaculia bacterium]